MVPSVSLDSLPGSTVGAVEDQAEQCASRRTHVPLGTDGKKEYLIKKHESGLLGDVNCCCLVAQSCPTLL